MNLVKVILSNFVLMIMALFTAMAFLEDFVDKHEFVKVFIAAWVVITIYSLFMLALILISML
jgi:hypothetical protein